MIWILILCVLGISGSYIPGTPGDVWSEEEVDIVRQKVRAMLDISSWRSGGAFLNDGTFSSDGSTGLSFDSRFCKSCSWGKNDLSMQHVPSPSKLLRLSFHDCVPYIDEEGHVEGGCDGCLNWSGMGFGYAGFPGPGSGTYNPAGKGDNNGLQTVAAALELVYRNPRWPSTAPSMQKSLWETGKSRADLWQFAAMVALEMEVERANFACDYDYNNGNQVRLLESEDKCFFKLFKPSVFKFGRIDCVPDESKKVTDFPYEATKVESHANTFGSAKHVLENLKLDFNLTAREGVSLMAVHATAPQQHNMRVPVKYRWIGNPYLSNIYFKNIAGIPLYRRYHALSTLQVSVGKKNGQPGTGNLLLLSCKNFWKSNMTDVPGGPCFWRPNMAGCNRPGEEATKGCFDHFAPDGSIVLKSGSKDKTKVCPGTTFDANRIQYSAEINSNLNTGKQKCSRERTFSFNYEANFMYEFHLDKQFRPYGCNGTIDNTRRMHNVPSISCPPNMDKYENGEPLSEITTSFGKNHDVWNHAFMEGWDKMVVNGYSEEQLVAGPKNSWFGYSSNAEVSFPYVFTDNKMLNPTVSNGRQDTIRENCLKKPSQCPLEFRIDHEDYFIGRLESPWRCMDTGSTLETINIQIRSNKDGKMLQLNSATGHLELGEANGDENQKWTYMVGCDQTAVLTNIVSSATMTFKFNPIEGSLANENGFVVSNEDGLGQAERVSYESNTKKPLLMYQWTIARA